MHETIYGSALEIVLTACRDFILEQQDSFDTAHDFNHLQRVALTARRLAEQEQARLDIVLPAAWLHDCVCLPKNSQLRKRASTLSAEKATELLSEFDYPVEDLKHIQHAIEAHSYSAGITPVTLEAGIVQDADRLDALGAIGIARCFATAGMMSSELYSGDDPFSMERTLNDRRFAIDHFYQKLFNLSETLNTDAAREMAGQRISFMRAYIQQLGEEILPPGTQQQDQETP